MTNKRNKRQKEINWVPLQIFTSHNSSNDNKHCTVELFYFILFYWHWIEKFQWNFQPRYGFFDKWLGFWSTSFLCLLIILTNLSSAHLVYLTIEWWTQLTAFSNYPLLFSRRERECLHDVPIKHFVINIWNVDCNSNICMPCEMLIDFEFNWK